MLNLQLFPTTHKEQKFINASFAFDKEVIALVKGQKEACWSQTLQSWCFLTKDFPLNRFYNALKGCVFIDYSQLRGSLSNNPLPKKIQALKQEVRTTEIYTHDSKKSLANIKNPLDVIIESQYSEKQHVKVNKNK